MKKGFLAILSLFLVHSLFAQETTERPFKKFTSFNEALQQAKKENKLLFVDIYFTGCHPCAQMDKEVYPNAVVLPVLEKNFISTKFNISNEVTGDTICLRYMVSGFPTLLVLDGDGRLISRASGFHDAGMFINLLNKSMDNAKNNKFLSGFSTTYVDDYPAFYKKLYLEKGERKVDYDEALKYIQSQKDWLSEKAALALFTCRFRLNNDMEEYLLKNYNQYANLYGNDMVGSFLYDILQKRLSEKLNKKPNDQVYESFLATYKSYFPEQDWKECLQVLNSYYYMNVAKDTTGYLKAMAKDPVLYKYYFTATTGGSVYRLTPESAYAQYLKTWAGAIVNLENPVEINSTIARVYQKLGDKEGYKKCLQLILDKINKYQMPNKDVYEKLLSEAS